MALTAVSCNRTAPQRPTQRTSEPPEADSTVMSVLEVNRRMACEADKILLEMADSLHRTTGTEYAQLTCGEWMSKRSAEERDRNMYADTPHFKEKWIIRLRTRRLDGTLLCDTEGTYSIMKFELPLAVENAVPEMHAGETATILAPWYSAYGAHGNEYVAGYENVIFEVTLKEKIED